MNKISIKMNLIALSGPKGSGKSYCSSILVDEYNYHRKSFAEPLKRVVSDIFNFTDECYDEKKKEQLLPEWNTTPRKLMQIIGTDLFRDQLKNYLPELIMPRKSIWESMMYNDIKQLRLNNPNIMITVDDVRFEDEYNCIKDLGGVVIKIYRSSVESGNNTDKHISESGCSYDYMINNNGTLADLKQKLIKISKMKNKK